MEHPYNYISCCGAYCKTCKELIDENCKGCKLGYENGERDINKAKCKIKLCSFKDNNYITCSDCDVFTNCDIYNSRFKVGTYNNKKYLGVLIFIKENGYDSFIKIADTWKRHQGKIK